MIGAIIGDIVGSRFEFHNHRSKDFDLFGKGCFATDDSIMTLAVAKAILEAANGKQPTNCDTSEAFYERLSMLAVKYMQEIGRKYPNCGYGGRFYPWVFSSDPQPYRSYGNGAAMRVSSAGFAAQSESMAKRLSEAVTAVTHNHPEGIKGAEATAIAIYMARHSSSMDEIRERINRDYYDLNFRIDDIRASYRFNETCQQTVPQAITCFLESTSFEDAIRTAISLGGDSDTIAAITGGIAEAYYGVPDAIREKALTYLDEELLAIYQAWQEFALSSCEQFLVLKESSVIDVLDERLYSFDSTVFALTPAVQRWTSESLINKITRFIDSVPAAQKAKDNVMSKTEYTLRFDLIPDEIQQALQNGKAEIIPCKDSSNAIYLQIRSTIKGLVIDGKEYGKHRKIKDIPTGTKQVPTDVAGAMQCLAMQNQLNQIANGLREISEACEFNFGRIIQGQRDDRLARLLSSRSCFNQALVISDEVLQKQMLLQAVCDANSARAELAFQIKSDILLLSGGKSPKSMDMKKMVSDINKAIVAMNNAVQLSLYSYQILGERSSQLAVVKEHETFIKQVLLKEIEYKRIKYPAWILICSSGNRGQTLHDFQILPEKLIERCKVFIDDNSESKTNLLEEKSNG